eukprot:TRINITY_DN34906_c0_g1_i1.p1 TRINITY_DN34906_c0_g1~~TRINITY_DN34906_c0_g1_i1.p1  ORF type:complete len:571 (-),score=99.10 TRINITY_DN34906_c0_g1_i1:56-1768(-)
MRPFATETFSLWIQVCLASAHECFVSSAGIVAARYGQACHSEDVQDGVSLLQHGLPQQQLARLERIEIGHSGYKGDGRLLRGGQEVVLLGGNYVLKAQPYFPDLEVVRQDARHIAHGVKVMKYRHPDKQILPCVRLGALFEGAMPQEGAGIDAGWAAKLEAVVEAFAAEGVYVFLDIHQDALSTTNGGEGLPWWIAAHMQKTARHGEAYIVSPDHPMSPILPEWLSNMLKAALPHAPQVKTAKGEHKDPWHAYAVGNHAGNPAFMNVGNLNMRLNNNDAAWSAGTLNLLQQTHNLAYRFWTSHKSKADRKAIFDPYVSFVRHLCNVWENHTNVVAVELLNEPPMGGFPDEKKFLTMRRELFNFYSAVLKALDEPSGSLPVRAPIAIEDVGGGISEGSPLMNVLALTPLHTDALLQLSTWAQKGQLLLSFHHYKNLITDVNLTTMVSLAKKQAKFLGAGAGVPIFLSEFYSSTAQGMADGLADAAELGVNCATFWHYVNTNYTGTEGWFKYPKAIVDEGEPVDGNGHINTKSWKMYEETVANGTFWGAPITGARGGQMNVLELVPARRLSG